MPPPLPMKQANDKQHRNSLSVTIFILLGCEVGVVQLLYSTSMARQPRIFTVTYISRAVSLACCSVVEARLEATETKKFLSFGLQQEVYLGYRRQAKQSFAG